jgi:flagellar biosynthesis/type III secretory pathway chaperone
MKLIEEKEAQLDNLSLLEDSFRMVVQNTALSQNLGITDDSSLKEILPRLPKPEGDKLSRLADGIINLVRQARELNLGNQSLVQTQIDWVQACRSFLFEGLQTADIYSHPAAPAQRMVVSGMEYRV